MNKILLLGVILSLSACQKSAAENTNIVSSPVISQTPTPIPTPSPNLNSPIKKIDFENFTYSWTEGFSTADTETFTLKAGEQPFERHGQAGISLEKIEYADVTKDGVEEAILLMSVQTGGSWMPNLIFIYTIKNNKPKLLWDFSTGDRAEGGFKKIYAENGELVVETFGDNKFERGKWNFKYPKGEFKGDCCPTAYTKIRFKWNGKKFAADGERELFDYDPNKVEQP